MNKGVLGLAWIVSVGAALYIGFVIGSGNNESPPIIPVTDTPEVEPQKPDASHVFDKSKRLVSGETLGAGHEGQEAQSTADIANADFDVADDESFDEHGQQLQELGEAFVQANEQASSHNALRNKFKRSYDESQMDLESEMNFTDFLQLHDDAHLIQLHQIACTYQECQLLGQFDGEHEGWESVIDQMQEQDWWQYRGTSSSSSTRDGVTYFNLYIDKGEQGD